MCVWRSVCFRQDGSASTAAHLFQPACRACSGAWCACLCQRHCFALMPEHCICQSRLASVIGPFLHQPNVCADTCLWHKALASCASPPAALNHCPVIGQSTGAGGPATCTARTPFFPGTWWMRLAQAAAVRGPARHSAGCGKCMRQAGSPACALDIKK